MKKKEINHCINIHKLFEDRYFDLQLFSGEKTEPATEKKREQAREQGNLPKSQDLNSVVIILAGFVGLRYYGPQIFALSSEFMRYCLTHQILQEMTLRNSLLIFNQILMNVVRIMTPFLMIMLFTSIIVNVYQVGLNFRLQPLTPDITKINPVSGLKNAFSSKVIAELVKSILKVLTVAYVPYYTISTYIPSLVGFIQLEPINAIIMLLRIIFTMAIQIIMLLVVVSIGDWYYQNWRYEENLKMSKQEIKDEHKQAEGDPKIKQKIREKQRQAATKRMMDEVPGSTVVVTNPTHIACALKYEPGMPSAPVVVAKGAGLIARRIKELAKENNVPVVENKPLARALYKMVEIGDEIHPDLYSAVVEILAQIYRTRQRAAGA